MKQCTRTAYTEGAANRKAGKNMTGTYSRGRKILEPAKAEYCDQCKAWHIKPTVYEKKP